MSTDDLGDLRRLTKPQNYPVENMSVGRYGNSAYRIGSASMQGFRCNMEDYFIIELTLSQHPTVGLFGIFDGHNGTMAARWFSENICKALDKLPRFSDELIQKTLFELDEEYLKVTENRTSGTTATFCLVEKIPGQLDEFPGKSHKVTVCHLGDSRLYIGKYSTPEFIQTTNDHKPANVTEKQRVIAAGGMVINGRIDSTLAVSRALGDHCYKANKGLSPQNQKVIALPEISISYVGNDDYLFICCDGVLEPRFVNNGHGIFNFLNEKLKSSGDTAQILSDLIRELLSSGARDNMTALLIEFKDGTDYNGGVEFIAGEYYEEYGNLSYVNAFKSNCELNGKTIEEVRALWFSRKEQQERKKEESDSTKKSD